MIVSLFGGTAMRNRYPRHSASGGFTLIEVLVALLILLIGLLGVAGTQLLSLQQVNNANLRSQVNNHAVEMVERIRGNNGQPVQAAEEAVWEASLVRAIPGATSAIAVANGVADVQITWSERVYGNDSAAQTFTLRARVAQ